MRMKDTSPFAWRMAIKRRQKQQEDELMNELEEQRKKKAKLRREAALEEKINKEEVNKRSSIEMQVRQFEHICIPFTLTSCIICGCY